jgi:hypothetical protein
MYNLDFEISVWDKSLLINGVVPMHYATMFFDKYNVASYHGQFNKHFWKWNKKDDTLLCSIDFKSDEDRIRFIEDNNLDTLGTLNIQNNVEALRFDTKGILPYTI